MSTYVRTASIYVDTDTVAEATIAVVELSECLESGSPIDLGYFPTMTIVLAEESNWDKVSDD